LRASVTGTVRGHLRDVEAKAKRPPTTLLSGAACVLLFLRAEHFRDQECQLQRLLGVQAGVAGGFVAA